MKIIGSGVKRLFRGAEGCVVGVTPHGVRVTIDHYGDAIFDMKNVRVTKTAQEQEEDRQIEIVARVCFEYDRCAKWPEAFPDELAAYMEQARLVLAALKEGT